MPKPYRPPSYWRRHREQKCGCGGYWFPHRRTGGACHYGPRADYYSAMRADVPEEECRALLTPQDRERMFPTQHEDQDEDHE